MMSITINATTTVSKQMGTPSLSCAFPVTCQLHNNEILCLYRVGHTKHSRDGILLVQKSFDDGISWRDPTTVCDLMGTHIPHSVHAGAICQTKDGVVHALFTAVLAQDTEEYIFSNTGRKLEQYFYSTQSHDNGATWTHPKVHNIPNTPHLRYINSRPFALPDGDLLVPIEVTKPDGCQAIMISRYSTSDRQFQPAIWCANDITGKLSFGDPSLARLPQGTIMVLSWTYVNATEATIQAHVTTSYDDGHIWTQPHPIGPICQNAALLAHSGNHMYIAGNVRNPPHGIRLWHSSDAGTTWNTDSPLQLYDMKTNTISGLPPSTSSDTNHANLNGDLWDSLPSFTFGAPDLTTTSSNNILLTYYAVAQNKEEVRACNFAPHFT